MDLIATLGLSPEELQDRIIERAVSALLETTEYYEDGDTFTDHSPLAQRLQKSVKETIDAKIAEIAEKHVLPNVSTYIENVQLQKTNEWGEKQGKPVTFIEYLVQRANAYMVEEVGHDGKTKSESGYSGYRAYGTRIAYMIDRHLQYSIHSAIETALKNANSTMAEGLTKACQIAINEAAQKFAIVAKKA